MHELGMAVSWLAIAAQAVAGPLRPTALSREAAEVSVLAPESVARMRALSQRICRDIGELVRERDDIERRLRMEAQDADTIRLSTQGARQALRARQDAARLELSTQDRNLVTEGGDALARDPEYRRWLESARDCLDE